MTCLELVDLLRAHFAYELPPELSRELIAHAADCSCCRNLVHTYEITLNLGAVLGEEAVPETVATRVRAALLRPG